MSINSEVPSASDVIQVVRRVVSQLAPEELELVDPAADAWVSGNLDKRRFTGAPGGGVGSGVEAYLLSELLFPIVSGAVGDVLGTIAAEPGRWKRKKHQPAPEQATPEPAAYEGLAGGRPLVPLTVQQAEKLHAACLEHGRAVGLSAARAAVLADAILGAMAR